MTLSWVVLQQWSLPMSPWLKLKVHHLASSFMKRSVRLLQQNDGHTDEISHQQFINLTPLSSTSLGAPLLQEPAMNDCPKKRCSDLEKAISRLNMITSHDAQVLRRAFVSAQALQHTLRASPSNGHEALIQFDNLQRIAFCKICNVSLFYDQWQQASLPVKSGGLGLRRVASQAPSAFIAPAVGTRDLQNHILQCFAEIPDKEVES